MCVFHPCCSQTFRACASFSCRSQCVTSLVNHNNVLFYSVLLCSISVLCFIQFYSALFSFTLLYCVYSVFILFYSAVSKVKLSFLLPHTIISHVSLYRERCLTKGWVDSHGERWTKTDRQRHTQTHMYTVHTETHTQIHTVRMQNNVGTSGSVASHLSQTGTDWRVFSFLTHTHTFSLPLLIKVEPSSRHPLTFSLCSQPTDRLPAVGHWPLDNTNTHHHTNVVML